MTRHHCQSVAAFYSLRASVRRSMLLILRASQGFVRDVWTFGKVASSRCFFPVKYQWHRNVRHDPEHTEMPWMGFVSCLTGVRILFDRLAWIRRMLEDPFVAADLSFALFVTPEVGIPIPSADTDRATRADTKS